MTRTLRGRRVLVAGAGVSGRSAAEALLAAGAEVTVTDASEERLAALDTVRAGGGRLVPGLLEPPEGTELLVTSPGWRPTVPLLTAAENAGITILGEVELAWWLDRQRPEPADWLAVTGTNGKTTTVTMLEAILRAAELDVVACGNVGLPVVDAVRAGHRVLAVELSSFQLHWSQSLAAHAGVVLNLADDHLDWHGTLDAYGAAKSKVYAGNVVAVHNADDEWSTRLATGAGRPVSFTLGEPGPDQLGIVDGALVDRAFADAGGEVLAAVSDVHPGGPHNLANALAAAALARAYGVPAAAVARGLRGFEPGAHRSAVVAEAAGVTYVDDSKATNPHAADAALRAHDRVVWIAGGLLKGAHVEELIAHNADRLAAVVLIGRDRAVFAEALARHAPHVPVEQVTAGDDEGMSQAVHQAAALATPGTAVLLAPAAASMDMFTDYAHRGRAFTEAVRALPAAIAPTGG
ncbi:UDP-N-acetylmuramoyl-L-alanine--D-glutamate ligase [Saccharopolyspora gloriosae]|uniref:UDP-N-acetylmuramoyl-L-alanine--D-glutamate ligase n=1 Tax=Saccharopolyspora gloriosae TaxID=455344 RepID=UPI001FB6D68C|nr:UDP-N-acetylmuramoyl-L-alanine--D-glutamate ligase [Saccharopolyspora gloriosae]